MIPSFFSLLLLIYPYGFISIELNLSDTTYGSYSIASIGVAAHEAGHAIQDHRKMALLNFQMSVVPVVNFASSLSVPIIIIGIILSIAELSNIGMEVFSEKNLFGLKDSEGNIVNPQIINDRTMVPFRKIFMILCSEATLKTFISF